MFTSTWFCYEHLLQRSEVRSHLKRKQVSQWPNVILHSVDELQGSGKQLQRHLLVKMFPPTLKISLFISWYCATVLKLQPCLKRKLEDWSKSMHATNPYQINIQMHVLLVICSDDLVTIIPAPRGNKAKSCCFLCVITDYVMCLHRIWWSETGSRVWVNIVLIPTFLFKKIKITLRVFPPKHTKCP